MCTFTRNCSEMNVKFNFFYSFHFVSAIFWNGIWFFFGEAKGGFSSLDAPNGAYSSSQNATIFLRILKLVTVITFKWWWKVNSLQIGWTYHMKMPQCYSLFALLVAKVKFRWICKCHRYTIQCFFFFWLNRVAVLFILLN